MNMALLCPVPWHCLICKCLVGLLCSVVFCSYVSCVSDFSSLLVLPFAFLCRIPDSVGDPRFEKETTQHETVMHELEEKINGERSTVEYNQENSAAQEEEAANTILTPGHKQQGLLRLLTLSPAPEPSEEDLDGPGGQFADQLVATFITNEHMAEGQSSVRGRDEGKWEMLVDTGGGYWWQW